jgi:hypothetical protein
VGSSAKTAEASEAHFCVPYLRNGALATGLRADSHATGQRLTQSLWPHLGADAVGLFVFPDGIMVNFAAFLAGLQADLPADLSPSLGRGCC